MISSQISILVVTILIASVAQLLLKKGMLVLGPMDFGLKNIIPLIMGILRNFYILFALFLYSITFILWLFILSKTKLSLVYPSLSAIYIFVILGSAILFNETIVSSQFFGIALILLGLFFIFRV